MKPKRKPKPILGIPSDEHASGETMTRLEKFPGGRIKVSRIHGRKGTGGGYKGRNEIFGFRQAQNLKNAVGDRSACEHAVVFLYPPAIRKACSRSESSDVAPLTPDELSRHIERLWANVRRWAKKHVDSERLEYVWVLEWQGKPYPHAHALLSVKVPVPILRDCWERAIRATRPDFNFSARTPWVGYSNKVYRDSMGAMKYLAKWEKGEKNPPTAFGFTSDRVWGASRLKDKENYLLTAKRAAPAIRAINQLAMAKERKRGLAKGSLRVTSERGKVLYFEKAVITAALSPHLTRLGHGFAFARITLRATVVAHRVIL